MIKLRCKVPNIEAAEIASAKWRCRISRTSENSVKANFALPHSPGPMGPGRSRKAAPSGRYYWEEQRSGLGRSWVLDRGYAVWTSEKVD